MSSINNENSFNLTPEETEKLSQFKECTQIEDELKCVQILRLNDWDLQTSISQTFDGAYQAAATSYPEPSSSSTLRQRTAATNSSNNVDNDVDQEVNGEVAEEAGEQRLTLSVYLWDTATWFICLPFVMAFNALTSIYDFVSTMIMPSLSIDSTGTVSRFVREFIEKYGNVHPEFMQMKFEDVLKLGKQEIKFVMVYIHSPKHHDTDRFCREVLCNPLFVECLERRSILFWSCSVTYPEGYYTFQKLHGSSFPFVAVFALRNNIMTMLRKLSSTSNVTEFVNEVQIITLRFGSLLESARLEREQRDLDTRLREQQDMAFLESLKADQEKARKKEEEEIQKSEEDRIRSEEEAKQIQREKDIKQMKTTLLKELRPEPEEGAEIIKIMFQLPGGKRLKRSFYLDDPVRHLYYFVFCNEETLINFKLHTNFPKEDLPGKSPAPEDEPISAEKDPKIKDSIKDCNLGNNIVLFVYDLDS